MLPAEWPLVVREQAREQFDVVAKIINSPKVERVICATDAGREGELIVIRSDTVTVCNHVAQRRDIQPWPMQRDLADG